MSLAARAAPVRPFTAEDAWRDVRERVFAPSLQERIGLEVEFLALDAGSRSPARLAGTHGLESVVRAHAVRQGWPEVATPHGAPRFRTPDGGSLSFEPGGQVEWSSSPAETVAAAVGAARAVSGPLTARAAEAGIRLLARGIDPYNDLRDTRLQLTGSRYGRMDRHLTRWAPYGHRMMRQTAALHVCLDFGAEPMARWAAAARLAPYLVAVFANSPAYAGRATGHRSFRAAQWRRVDPSRTGQLGAEEGPREFLDRALAAPHFLADRSGHRRRRFGDRLEAGQVGREEWLAHLSTLFFEVRPRGYLEFRSMDALPPRWFCAPVVFLVGLLYDHENAEEVVRRLPLPTAAQLRLAGRRGLTDPDLGPRCRRLFRAALAGAARLGSSRVGRSALSEAEAYYEAFTSRGLDPGSEGASALD